MSFQQAVDYVKTLPKDGPVQLDNSEKLKFYSLFKQATEGDVTGTQPWAVQMEARAKWDAWNERKGMAKDAAQAEYARLLTEVVTAKTGKSWQ